MPELDLESLRRFVNHSDFRRSGYTTDSPIEVPFELTPRQLFAFATQDFREKYNHHLVNALSNVKRAIECQLDSLLVAFSLFDRAAKEDWSLPKKVDLIERLGIVAPDILKRINRKRNLLEHEYSSPQINDVEDALDVARLFIELTDQFLVSPINDVELTRDDRPDWVDMSFEWRPGVITIASLVRGSGVQAKKVVDRASQEYFDYLQFYVSFCKNR